MSWSQNQENIFATIPEKTSLIIEAVAGSGKTTTIVEYAKRTKACRGLAIAFSKRIASELEARMPRHFECKTMNALGHRSWIAALQGKKIKLDANKLFNCAKDLNIPSELIGDAMALARMARVNGIVPRQETRNKIEGFMPDAADSWEELADTFDLEYSADLLVYSRELLAESINQAFNGVIDFDDQLYMTVLFDAPFPPYDIIIIDEVQDLSPLQHEMVARFRHKTSRIIAVGDSHQAIYGFRGADNNSMTNFRDKFNLKELPLTISYRCPKRVVKEAQKYVSHIETSDTALDGQVYHNTDKISLFDLDHGAAVLCRNTAPLVETAWKLIRAGISVNFLGKQLGKGLTRLVTKLAQSPISIDIFKENLIKWSKREIQRRPRTEPQIQDKVDTLLILSRDCQTTAELHQKIERIFESTTGAITLATIHTSKGFEWDTVYILNKHLIPSVYATQPWQLEQEDNLMYVAITRAKNTLVYIDSDDLMQD